MGAKSGYSKACSHPSWTRPEVVIRPPPGGSAETRRAVKHARGERNNERSRETPHDSDRYFSQAWATRELPRACLFSSVVKGPRRQMTLTSLWLPHGRVITGHKHSFVGNFFCLPKFNLPYSRSECPHSHGEHGCPHSTNPVAQTNHVTLPYKVFEPSLNLRQRANIFLNKREKKKVKKKNNLLLPTLCLPLLLSKCAPHDPIGRQTVAPLSRGQNWF